MPNNKIKIALSHSYYWCPLKSTLQCKSVRNLYLDPVRSVFRDQHLVPCQLQQISLITQIFKVQLVTFSTPLTRLIELLSLQFWLYYSRMTWSGAKQAKNVALSRSYYRCPQKLKSTVQCLVLETPTGSSEYFGSAPHSMKTCFSKMQGYCYLTS